MEQASLRYEQLPVSTEPTRKESNMKGLPNLVVEADKFLTEMGILELNYVREYLRAIQQ